MSLSVCRRLGGSLLAVRAALVLTGASFGPVRPDEAGGLRAGRIGFTADAKIVPGGYRIRAPYRSQRDGSIYEGSNCGVAAIAMVLAHFGQAVPTLELRESINAMTGIWGPDAGIPWQPLMQAVQGRGLTVDGPFDGGGGFRPWTIDDLRARTAEGKPVLALVRYRSLPGHETADYWGDHYVVVLGATADGRLVYHDPAFNGHGGAYRLIDAGAFERAWSGTWIGQNRTAMAIFAG